MKYTLKLRYRGRFLVTEKELFSKMGIGVGFISEEFFLPMENDRVLKYNFFYI
jgi:hypothetical protein